MEITKNSQFRASDAISCNVRTATDESVGTIRDFVINTSNRQIDYVVLAVDEGFLNLGSKLLALPVESFEFNPALEDVVVVRETQETLENAPGFDTDNWPSGPQTEFLHAMRAYYSEEPRSLYGRYDHENRAFYSEEDQFDTGPGRIRSQEFGDEFLESDPEDRQSDLERDRDPLL